MSGWRRWWRSGTGPISLAALPMVGSLILIGMVNGWGFGSLSLFERWVTIIALVGVAAGLAWSWWTSNAARITRRSAATPIPLGPPTMPGVWTVPNAIDMDEAGADVVAAIYHRQPDLSPRVEVSRPGIDSPPIGGVQVIYGDGDITLRAAPGVDLTGAVLWVGVPSRWPWRRDRWVGVTVGVYSGTVHQLRWVRFRHRRAGLAWVARMNDGKPALAATRYDIRPLR